MAFCQAIGGEKDEDGDAQVSEERQKCLNGQGWVAHRVKKHAEPFRSEDEFVFSGRTDGVKEVVKNDGRDRQSFEDGRITTVEFGQAFVARYPGYFDLG